MVICGFKQSGFGREQGADGMFYSMKDIGRIMLNIEGNWS